MLYGNLSCFNFKGIVPIPNFIMLLVVILFMDFLLQLDKMAEFVYDGFDNVF